eukprot:6379082-Prymnesium_polylepis.2
MVAGELQDSEGSSSNYPGNYHPGNYERKIVDLRASERKKGRPGRVAVTLNSHALQTRVIYAAAPSRSSHNRSFSLLLAAVRSSSPPHLLATASPPR